MDIKSIVAIWKLPFKETPQLLIQTANTNHAFYSAPHLYGDV